MESTTETETDVAIVPNHGYCSRNVQGFKRSEYK